MRRRGLGGDDDGRPADIDHDHYSAIDDDYEHDLDLDDDHDDAARSSHPATL